MRILIQRVTRATLRIEEQIHSRIGAGLMVLIGIEEADSQSDIEYLVNKMVNLRIFADENDVMNLSVKDVGGEVMLVSQFTLQASTKKGNRPSYIRAAHPTIAEPLYRKFIEATAQALGKDVATGVFGADMQIELVNDGPVTIWIDSQNIA